MPTEIRPVTRAEVVDYLRVLPFANGLPWWEPAPAAWYAGAGAFPAPGPPLTDEALAAYTDIVLGEGFHSQAAFVDGRIVGGSAMLSLELTVPGLRQVAMGGVTSTGVIATHRRRGLLRAMMTAMLQDSRDRGECLAGLSASEGSIYGRYGFSPATFQVRWELERGDARSRVAAAPDRDLPDHGTELVDADVAARAWPALHERIRHERVGEVSANPETWKDLNGAATGDDGPLRFLVHRGSAGDVDGIAHFRLPWSADPALLGTVQVEVLDAATPTAYEAMWRLLCDVDLTRRVVAARRPVDEPLRWMLGDPRALRVTRSSDNLWLRVLDVGAALEARSYDAAGTVVLRVDDPLCPWNDGHWRLVADPDGAHCRQEPPSGGNPRPAADLALDIATLGSLYLGGVSPAVLAAAGRLVEHTPGAVATLTRLFRQDPAPFNRVGF